MRPTQLLALLVLGALLGSSGLAACKNRDRATASPEVQGTLALDGKPLVVTRCMPGRGVTTFVELATAVGKLRFEDRQLFWNRDIAAVTRGDRLECEKLDRSWGGGQRPDGSSYFRGTLDFRCIGTVGALVGNVTADCGQITAEERRSLDENRDKTRAAQAADAGVADRCTEVEAREAALFEPGRQQALEQARGAGLEPTPGGKVQPSGSGGIRIRAFAKPVAFTACRDDAWPAVVQDCLLSAATIDAWDECLETLPPALRRHYADLQAGGT